MSDRYDQDTILGYVEGELDDKQRASFESVLAGDTQLRNLVAQMKLDRQALRRLGMKPAPIGLVDQVIQSQERAALLGEPEVPEPMPMVLPVSRHKLRRVLAYSGVAAVLLLSAALVIPTLMPSGLLHRQSPVAHHDTDTDAMPARPMRNRGYALLDEDAAYDRAAAPRTLARTDAGPSSPAAKDAPPETPPGITLKIAPVAAPEVAAAIVQDAQTPQAQAVAALAERVQSPEPVSSTAETAGEPGAETPVEKVELAQAQPVNPFAGYGGAVAGADTHLADDSQLLINTASPTLARRDLRDWAIANSARVDERDALEKPVRNTDGSTHLTVEIDPAQVPKLLAYLNRNADQRAELVASTREVAATLAVGRDGERARQRRAERPAREAERDPSAEPAHALTNSMVDTQSPWPRPNLATGLAPTQPQADTRRAKADQEQPKEEPATTADQAAEPVAKDTPDYPDTANPKPFDWANLLDAAVNKPVTPPAPPYPTPRRPPAPRPRRRRGGLLPAVPTDPPAPEP